MLDRSRWCARPRKAGRSEPARRLGLALALLALASLAHAREPAVHVSVQVDASLPGAAAEQLVSALEAQLVDLASIDLTQSSAHALCVVSITQAQGGLSIQFTDVRAAPLTAPRFVSDAPGELAASQVASIVRAFVVARLDSDAAVTAESEPAATPQPEAKPLSSASALEAGSPEPATAAATSAATLLTPPPAAENAPRAAAPAHPTDQLVRAGAAPWRLRIAALYTGTTYARELPWQNGLRAEASARLSDWTYLGVGYAYHLPAQVDDGRGVQIRVSAHALSAFFGLGRSWRSFGAALDAGFGLTDTLRTTTQVTTPGLEQVRDSKRWSPLCALRLHGRVRLLGASRIALDLAPALEISPGTGDFVVDIGAKSAVLSPRLLRARLDVGASFDVF